MGTTSISAVSGSFILKKRAAKIGRNIKRNIALEIPEHYIPAFKPAKEFAADIKMVPVRNGHIEEEVVEIDG